MINNQYQLYVDEVFNLAETLVVKFEDAALALNTKVQIEHGYEAVNPAAPESWKYYQNISGQYHFSDVPMVVSSLDTIEQIVFNQANLVVHEATRVAYAYGSRYYHELVSLYPEQELLILGVLYPCDMAQAIAARDGTILAYPAALVQPNELSFISKLQAWAYKYLGRWVNRQFAQSDDLYAATYIGQFFMHLVQAIFTFRMEACKTNEAHRFHVQQYLASHGMLDAYLANLTHAQALFLYRNILYLQRNAGKRDTFDWLLEELMTKRHLPVYGYSMTHDVSVMSRTDPSSQTGLLPAVAFKRKPLNAPAELLEKTTYTFDQVLAKVAPAAAGNEPYHTQYSPDMQDMLAYAPSATLATKLLESSVVDYLDAVPYPLTGILFNHWVHWVALGKYDATVMVNFPRGGSVVRLQAADAVTLFLYALSRAMAPNLAPLERIPRMQLQRVLRTPKPSMHALLTKVGAGRISQSEVQSLYDTVPVIGAVHSIDAFYAQATAVYTAAAQQHVFYSTKEHQIRRGQAKALVSALYSDEVVTLPRTGMLYSDWFASLGLSVGDYTGQEFYDFAVSIAAIATGINSHMRYSLAAVQTAMVKLFTQLSSYSVQMIADVNQIPYLIVPTPSARVGDQVQHHHAHSYLDACDVRLSDPVSQEAATTNLGWRGFVSHQAPHAQEHAHTSVYLPAQIRKSPTNIPTLLGRVNTRMSVSALVSAAERASGMSIAQRFSLVDEYCECGVTNVGVDEVILPSFLYVGGGEQLDGFVTGTYLDERLNNLGFVGGRQTLVGFTYQGPAMTQAPGP